MNDYWGINLCRKYCFSSIKMRVGVTTVQIKYIGRLFEVVESRLLECDGRKMSPQAPHSFVSNKNFSTFLRDKY